MIDIGYKTDRGQRRLLNEDACFVMPEQRVYMVADGVGGAAGGDMASKTAMYEITRYINGHKLIETATAEDIRDYFQDCLTVVNGIICETSRTRPELTGMATTVTICCIRQGKAVFISVGDSRGYVIRRGIMTQITEDHTYVNEMLKAGIITEEDQIFKENRHVITRALGADDDVEPDFKQVILREGDTILLCTDGLYNEIVDEDIVEVFEEASSMREAALDLVNMANYQGGNDNITVVCLRI